MPAAQHVHVQVIHGLPAICSCIDHHPIAFREAFVPGNLCPGQQEVTQQVRVLLAGVGCGTDVLARNHKEMHRRLRVDVAECIAAVVAEDRLGGNCAFDDFAEQAIHRHQCTRAAPKPGTVQRKGQLRRLPGAFTYGRDLRAGTHAFYATLAR